MGTRITRLPCQLVIDHDGTLKVFLRTRDAIRRRLSAQEPLITITNAGHIRDIENGLRMSIDCMKVGMDIEQTTLHQA